MSSIKLSEILPPCGAADQPDLNQPPFPPSEICTLTFNSLNVTGAAFSADRVLPNWPPLRIYDPEKRKKKERRCFYGKIHLTRRFN